MRFFYFQPFDNVHRAISVCVYPFLIFLLLAQAANADAVIHEDHNHHRLLNLFDQDDVFKQLEVKASKYEPDFAGLDRGIIGRAQESVRTLSNNAPKPTDIDQGDIQYWTFPRQILQERDLRQLMTNQSATGSAQEIYLTISTCDQPTSTASRQIGNPAQLEVYISHSPDNQKPDSGRNDGNIAVVGGYGNLTLSNITGDIWIGVRAPPSNDFKGKYNYELVASIDAPYTTYFKGENPTPWDTEIEVWDTDTNSSVLGTGPITKAAPNSTWMNLPPPFRVYVHNRADPAILGLQRSVCGLRNHAEIRESDNRMVNIGGQPKQLFYVKGLNRSSSYDAIMTLEGPSSNLKIGGGGAVWKNTNFATKSDNNCRIIYNLTFCTDVAYAVPFNSNFTTDMNQLAITYNEFAQNAYQGFNKSLQQIPCETTPSAQYSLARSCDDCAKAYKTWLCAVTIPRCADFSSPSDLTHLLPRNVRTPFFINGTTVPSEPEGSLFSEKNKSTSYYGKSRNSMIDDQIKPGPYKEVLPCKDLCYHLTQSCPAALEFACPLEGRELNFSYGHWRKGDKEWRCNWPGGTLWSGEARMGASGWFMGFMLVVALYLL
ncbi:MAG: hypothetical protein Q9201_001853 [Fulgogasparrea decipioides]